MRVRVKSLGGIPEKFAVFGGEGSSTRPGGEISNPESRTRPPAIRSKQAKTAAPTGKGAVSHGARANNARSPPSAIFFFWGGGKT